MTARVLLVCTANICRSPAAARLLAGRLGPSVEVASRGTHARPGAGMCEVSADCVRANGGGPVDGHASTQLTLADVRAATLILTASGRHRAAVIELRPSAQVRTFTLLQAARIARWRAGQGGAGPPTGAELPDRLLWLAEELDAHRGLAAHSAAGVGDDLPDPHHGAPHAAVLTALVAAVDAFCAPLLAAPPVRLRPRRRESRRRESRQKGAAGPERTPWPESTVRR